MAVLNSKFDILRGWPDGSAVAEDLTKSTKDATHPAIHRAGHFVLIGRGTDGVSSANNSVGGDLAATDSGYGNSLGLIIEGEEETSSLMSNTVTCLVGGGYVVRLHLEADLSSNAYGSAGIPGGVNQYLKVRGAATLEGVADISIAAGQSVIVKGGVVMSVDPDNLAVEGPGIIGVVLATSNDTIDLLVH